MTVSKPFDARKTLLRESSLAPDARSTVGLVAAVRGIVGWAPPDTLAWPVQPEGTSPDSVLAAFRAATEELTRRGLDADSLVRYGMRNEIAGSLMSLLLAQILGLDISDMVRQRGIDLDAWNKVLPRREQRDPSPEISLDLVVRVAAEATRSQTPLLLDWIMRAPLEALVTLPAPSEGGLATVAATTSADLHLYEQYAWLVDRFATTSIRDWLTSSLHNEYRWLAEQQPPPCPAPLMLEREVGAEELNAEIARRTALNVADGAPDPEAVLASEMHGHARTLLRNGRCREAAALFEFAVQRRPADPVARNNLGFCLIPEHPRAAMSHLEAAAHMGYGHTVVNVYNRVCCHLSLRQARAGIAAAEAFWAVQDDRSGSATLWRWLPDGTWEIGDVIDPYHALADLAARVSQAEGWREDEQRWRERIESRQSLSRPLREIAPGTGTSGENTAQSKGGQEA